MWIFVCANYEHFVRWCEFENDPPINPRDRHWVVVHSGSFDGVQRARGRHLDPAKGDRLIKHTLWQDGRYAEELRYMIGPIENRFVEVGGKVEYVST